MQLSLSHVFQPSAVAPAVIDPDDLGRFHVLVACEYSGVVRRAFAAAGFDAWSCDLLPA